MDNLTENTNVTADTAEADKGEQAAAVLGKFKDVKTLIKAYSDLEAEFTRRSQRLKELEKENKAATVPDGGCTPPSRADGTPMPPSRADGTATPPSRADGTATPPSRGNDEERILEALKNEKVRDAIIGDYLKGLAENKVPLVGGGGGGVTAPRNTPKTVKEAGKLAQRFLNG